MAPSVPRARLVGASRLPTEIPMKTIRPRSLMTIVLLGSAFTACGGSSETTDADLAGSAAKQAVSCTPEQQQAAHAKMIRAPIRPRFVGGVDLAAGNSCIGATLVDAERTLCP